MGRGGSESQLLRFDDKLNRVVKFPNNPQGLIVLVNEIIVSRIAEFLGVCCPKGDVVVVPQELIESEPRLRRSDGQKFVGGYCFGSDFHEAMDDPGSASLARASNSPDLAGIVVLDTLCANGDRENNQGNLLLTTVAGNMKVMAIDHGHCFGHRWDEAIASIASGVRVICRNDFASHLQAQHFQPFLSKLRELDEEALKGLLDDLEGLWDLGYSRLAAIKRYISGRRTEVEQAIRVRWQ